MDANDVRDEDEQQEPQESTPNDHDPVVISAAGVGVDGEHGPLFSGVDLALTSGLHAIQLPGGPGQDAFLLTLAGRLNPSSAAAGERRSRNADMPATRYR